MQQETLIFLGLKLVKTLQKYKPSKYWYRLWWWDLTKRTRSFGAKMLWTYFSKKYCKLPKENCNNFSRLLHPRVMQHNLPTLMKHRHSYFACSYSIYKTFSYILTWASRILNKRRFTFTRSNNWRLYNFRKSRTDSRIFFLLFQNVLNIESKRRPKTNTYTGQELQKPSCTSRTKPKGNTKILFCRSLARLSPRTVDLFYRLTEDDWTFSTSTHIQDRIYKRLSYRNDGQFGAHEVVRKKPHKIMWASFFII